MTELLAILGGTFDPVHFGHLRPALEVREALGVERIHLVPARTPPHRDDPGADAKHRLAMLELAVEGLKELVIDRRELERDGPSYSVDTLQSLREEYPDRPLALVIGEDAFASLSTWRRWQRIPELAHIVVMTRPGAPRVLDAALENLAAERRLDDPAQLGDSPSGGLAAIPVTPLAISASGIRALIREDRDPRWLLPDAVRAYIIEHGLYRDA